MLFTKDNAPPNIKHQVRLSFMKEKKTIVIISTSPYLKESFALLNFFKNFILYLVKYSIPHSFYGPNVNST